MRRIAPAIRTLVEDIGLEGWLILAGVAGLALWSDGEHQLDALLVIAVSALLVGIALARPAPKGS